MLRQQDARNFMWVPGYGLNIHQISWISFFEWPNSIIPCTCSSNLKYSIKFNETKKLTKYSKKSQNCPKFEHGVLNNVARPHKKWVKKTNFFLPSAGPGTRQRGPLPSARKWHSAKKGSLPSAGLGTWQRPFLPSARASTRQRIFFNLTAWAGSAVKFHFFCRVPLFAECCTRQRGLLPSAALCRVPGTLWHSAKPLFAEC